MPLRSKFLVKDWWRCWSTSQPSFVRSKTEKVVISFPLAFLQVVWGLMFSDQTLQEMFFVCSATPFCREITPEENSETNKDKIKPKTSGDAYSPVSRFPVQLRSFFAFFGFERVSAFQTKIRRYYQSTPLETSMQITHGSFSSSTHSESHRG